MNRAPIIEATGITKRFGGFIALHAVDFSLGARERVGLIAQLRERRK